MSFLAKQCYQRGDEPCYLNNALLISSTFLYRQFIFLFSMEYQRIDGDISKLTLTFVSVWSRVNICFCVAVRHVYMCNKKYVHVKNINV